MIAMMSAALCKSAKNVLREDRAAVETSLPKNGKMAICLDQIFTL